MKPLIVLVDDAPQALDRLEHDVARRYGADYDVLAFTSAVAALQQLKHLSHLDAAVALVIADQWMPELSGTDFLVRAHEMHPGAKRLLVIDVGDTTAEGAIVRALTLNQLDYYFGKPWASPEEELYPTTGEALREWARTNLPRYEKVKLVAPLDSTRAQEVRDVLERNSVATGFYPVESPEGRALFVSHVGGGDRFPVLILYDGRVLVDPSYDEIARAMGGATDLEPGLYDVTVVGAGPAGLAAAVYAAAEGLRTVVIEPAVVGGQASMSPVIRNYFGFPWGIAGSDLTERGERQAVGFGARLVLTRHATQLRRHNGHVVITLSNGQQVTASTAVIATGVSYRTVDAPGLAGLVGAGVFYGGTSSYAPWLVGLHVCVLGGGNSAGQAALSFGRAGAEVTLLVRGNSLEKRMSGYLVDEIRAAKHIRVRLNTEVAQAIGNQRLEVLVLRNTVDATTEALPTSALFIFAGAEPRTEWLNREIACDEHGFLLTGLDLSTVRTSHWELPRAPLLLETSAPGVFAAGDVRHGSAKRVAAAVGEGSTAVLLVRQYLEAR